jgi:protein-L-isoaspartate(D-aspartate) O-methyltransferase
MRHALLVVALFAAVTTHAAPPDRYLMQRERMVTDIAGDVHDTCLSLTRKQPDPRVFAAMREVPRHEFVPDDVRPDAYENRPLAIGYGQTISQPYIVGIMTALMAIRPDAVVLEIGTGSGYQAAILSRMVRQVYTTEIIEPLARSAAKRLRELGYSNIEVRHADGYYGWKEHAPYDAIIVTAAASHVPPSLVAQLKPGGVMIIPVGGGFAVQQLVLVTRLPNGGVTTRQVLPVLFVPLTGSH